MRKALSRLVIGPAVLEPSFRSRTYEYTATYDPESIEFEEADNMLTITVEPSNDLISVEIIAQTIVVEEGEIRYVDQGVIVDGVPFNPMGLVRLRIVCTKGNQEGQYYVNFDVVTPTPSPRT